MITNVDLIDVKELTSIVQEKYKEDFSEFATTAYRRRVEKAGNDLRIPTMSVLLEKIKTDPATFQKFKKQLIIPTTEFFRDPSFWRKLREEISKKHKATAFRVWVAGCSTGEELISLAILLKELEIYDNSKILATEITDQVFSDIKMGHFEARSIETGESNYERFEGKKKFSDYLKTTNGMTTIDTSLLTNITFQASSIDVSDITGKFDLILCRNVFIYCNLNLQDKMIKNFEQRLFPSGLFAIGVKESLNSSRHKNSFTVISEEENIYKSKM